MHIECMWFFVSLTTTLVANNYRQSSFEVPCTKEEYDALNAAVRLAYHEDRLHESVLEQMQYGDFETDDNGRFILNEEEPIVSELVHCHLEDDKSLWIYGEEFFDVDMAGYVVQELLKIQIASGSQPPDAYVSFSYADTCSKPRLDEFSGGACVVTATGMACEYAGSDESVARMKEKINLAS